MMVEVSEKTIDIAKVLKDKMGKKARYVPGFIVSWLERIIHQDEVNAFLWEKRDLVGTEWLEATLKYLDATIDLVGVENLPDKDDGRLYTFVSNHPLGGEDGVALGAIIGRHYDSRFRYLVNDLLMNLPGWLRCASQSTRLASKAGISRNWWKLASRATTTC